MAQRTVRVEGLRELSRAFSVAAGTLDKELKEGLKDAAQPVAVEASVLASTQIRNMSGPWSEMRIGVTRTSVYVAPKRRATRGSRKRKNLASLLLERAMLPALERNVPEVVEGVEHVLDTVGRVWERA